MHSRLFFLLLCLLALTGCDKIKSLSGGGVANPKELDAQAIGYACRVSKKSPEACMKENESFSPTFILSGWKSADKDIKDRVIVDIGTGSETAPASAVRSAPPAEGKAAETR